MPLQPLPTLGQLRDELAMRLGFAAQLGHLGAHDHLLRAFLEDAQKQLWWQFDWPQTYRTVEREMGVDQERYDYPDLCSPSGLLSVAVAVGEGHGWRALREAMGWQVVVMAGSDAHCTSGWPLYFARREQLYVWPVPRETGGRLRVSFKPIPTRFTVDSDRCALDDRAVFLQALVAAKLHFRQPDASYVRQQLDKLLMKLRAASHGDLRYDARADGPKTHFDAAGGWHDSQQLSRDSAGGW